MTALLVVEDDPAIRESLVDFFGGRGREVTAVAGAHAAERLLGTQRFDVVLLDLVLPDGDGLALLRRLRGTGDRTPVLVLTARGEESQRIEGLRLGADDYVVKPFSVRELDARIDAVLRRAAHDREPVTVGDVELDLAGHTIVRNGARIALLPKEAELLAFLVGHPSRTFRRDELLRAVWGYDALPTTRTVDTHVFQLRKKLEPDPSRPRHLLTVHGVGYRLVL